MFMCNLLLIQVVAVTERMHQGKKCAYIQGCHLKDRTSIENPSWGKKHKIHCETVKSNYTVKGIVYLFLCEKHPFSERSASQRLQSAFSCAARCINSLQFQSFCLLPTDDRLSRQYLGRYKYMFSSIIIFRQEITFITRIDIQVQTLIACRGP